MSLGRRPIISSRMHPPTAYTRGGGSPAFARCARLFVSVVELWFEAWGVRFGDAKRTFGTSTFPTGAAIGLALGCRLAAVGALGFDAVPTGATTAVCDIRNGHR